METRGLSRRVATDNGRDLRYFNRDRLCIDVDFSLPAERVIRSLNQIIELRGKPFAIVWISDLICRWQIDEMGRNARSCLTLHPTRKTATECGCRALQPDTRHAAWGDQNIFC